MAFDGPLPPGMAGMMGAGQPAPAGPQGGMQPIQQPPLPASLRAAPPGAGPVSMPQGNPGNSMAALSMVQTAVLMLQKALPAIPMGSDAHNDVLKAVSALSKHVSDAQGTQSQIAQLMQAIKSAAAAQPQAALSRIAPNAPPAMPSNPSPDAGASPGGMGMPV